jgi:endonuclease/exonuclease/phosphatase family metal-dependent hydrolase
VSIRVLTWNLWWRFGAWQEREAAILATLELENADIICLQETWASDSGESQVARIAESLGYSHGRTPSPFWEGYSFGNAVLSRWPILSCETHPLPDNTGRPTPRTACVVRIDAPVGVITVVCCHLEYRFDRSATRLAQTRSLANLVSSIRGTPDEAFPTLLVGDFNAIPSADEMRHLTGLSAPEVPGLIFHDAWELAGDGSPGHTWSSDNPLLADATWPNRRLDYIMVSWPRPKGVGTPISCRVTGRDLVDGVMPSDHYAVVAELRTERVKE